MFTFKNYLSATSLEEAYNELMKNKKNILLGGTSYLRMGNVAYNTAIDLSNLSLDYIKEDSDGCIHMGAMVRFRDLETNPITKAVFDGILDRCVRGIIGVQFRSNVTIGATVFSKYGFSDLIPTLLAMNATVVLYHGGEISLEEYLKESETRRDILVEIKFMKDGKGSFQSIRKTKTDYAITNACVTKSQNSFRIAIGVRPGKAVLAYKAMEILNNSEVITEDTIENACKAIEEEITFGSNMRGTGDYRRAVSKTLVKRAIKEVL